MTIREIIERAEKKLKNAIGDEDKIRWLSELDLQIYEDVILTHAGPISAREFPYTNDTAELIAPERYSPMYEAYLRARIELAQDEIERYTNDILLFNEGFAAFKARYNETHMPIQKPSISTAPTYSRSGVNVYPFN